ncbi:META domain-containing protein [Dysgonomonas macrotermitis]|uniref:Heat shock protein HslJ n=1 Tax=Dysgonomonas macrotermitis TaxID=1346286 RepID=A0A1M5GQV6_9BACT|nr:META domain-containing protein [Dysgonomonas macrotermitis]SHG06104.1 Heat shock protein HslJ [Dysgonomonas macrotermitis]
MKKLTSKMLLLLAVLLLGITAQSCKSGKDSAKSSTASGGTTIEGTWILKSLDGVPAADIFKGKIPSLTINLTDRLVYGNGGCNRYSGPFTFQNNILSAPNLRSTLMACIFDNKEGEYLAMLAKDNKVTFTATTLTLENGGKVTAEFVKGVDLSEIAGTKWTLEAIDGKDAKSLFQMQDKLPTLELDTEKSTIHGNAGCNHYNASYKLEGSSITVGPAMSTKMACPNLEGESAFTQALTGVSELKTTGTAVLFVRDGKEVLKFVRATN